MLTKNVARIAGFSAENENAQLILNRLLTELDLHDQLRLSVHRKDQRALGLLQLSGEGR